jgi:hypothetical protein
MGNQSRAEEAICIETMASPALHSCCCLHHGAGCLLKVFGAEDFWPTLRACSA